MYDQDDLPQLVFAIVRMIVEYSIISHSSIIIPKFGETFLIVLCA
jgi:hypothetical protein